MIGILFALFLLLIFVGIPIGFSVGFACLSFIFVSGYPIGVVSQRMFTAIDSFPLMAVPLFMFAGSIMNSGGITKRLIDTALAFVGGLKGSLGAVAAVVGVLMGGISGSGVADTAAIGSILLPEMKKRNYKKSFSGAIVAASGSLGLIIPPSITMIIYCVSTESSISAMFMAGIIPGVVMGIGFVLYSVYYATKHDYPVHGKSSTAQKIASIKDTIWALLMPLIIVVGLRSGIFTPTEGAAVVCVYGLIIGIFVYKEIDIHNIIDICYEAAISTATIAITLAATTLFGWILTSAQFPQAVTQFILSLTDNGALLMIIINIFLLIVGMFMDAAPAILILAPILLPVATQIGMHPVQFGLIMIINLTIGLLTPPVGSGVFVVSKFAESDVMELAKDAIPFILIMLAVLAVVTFLPTSWFALL